MSICFPSSRRLLSFTRFTTCMSAGSRRSSRFYYERATEDVNVRRFSNIPALRSKEVPLFLRLVSATTQIASTAGSIARKVVQSGDLRVVDKGGGNDPQTVADRAIQAYVVQKLRQNFPKVTIIGEEGDSSAAENESFEYLIPPSASCCLQNKLLFPEIPDLVIPDNLRGIKEEDVVIWIDPLDGTTEFTKGGLSHVTTLIGIAHEGRPVAGIIHEPFSYLCGTGRTIYGIPGVGHGGVHVMPIQTGKRIITTTQSHSNPRIEAAIGILHPYKVLRVGGTGHKALFLVEGVANAYVFASKGLKKWDTCAIEALITAVGGRVDYMNEGGLVATAPGENHDWYIQQFMGAESIILFAPWRISSQRLPVYSLPVELTYRSVTGAPMIRSDLISETIRAIHHAFYPTGAIIYQIPTEPRSLFSQAYHFFTQTTSSNFPSLLTGCRSSLFILSCLPPLSLFWTNPRAPPRPPQYSKLIVLTLNNTPPHTQLAGNVGKLKTGFVLALTLDIHRRNNLPTPSLLYPGGQSAWVLARLSHSLALLTTTTQQLLLTPARAHPLAPPRTHTLSRSSLVTSSFADLNATPLLASIGKKFLQKRYLLNPSLSTLAPPLWRKGFLLLNSPSVSSPSRGVLSILFSLVRAPARPSVADHSDRRSALLDCANLSFILPLPQTRSLPPSRTARKQTTPNPIAPQCKPGWPSRMLKCIRFNEALRDFRRERKL
ncbi:3'(2'),5'-bisphosphate nucleotidase 1 [Orchesella cincta]|uniref:3'(2'),5'-bisphosphate nucleotidase 1 n=1 Tax=Orchesella cincta TaxID=48709 RepID=A0A1D2MF81_ORCCI|nr:3'(2'),5'-bisphosphate nucleotidase 1 [Orchesella cincta]